MEFFIEITIIININVFSAQEAKRSRRLLSCPERFVPVPPSVRFINTNRSHVSNKLPHVMAASSCRPNSVSIAWLNVSPRSSEYSVWPVILVTNGDGQSSVVSPRNSVSACFELLGH